MLRLVVLITAAALVGACGKDEKNAPAKAEQVVPPASAPKTIIVRVNGQTGARDYATYSGPVDINQIGSTEFNQLNWQPVNQNQMVNKQNGYPQYSQNQMGQQPQQQQNPYMFVDQPSNFQQNPGGQVPGYINNVYGYGYGCANGYGCGYGYAYGYNAYPNYYRYGAHYYAPNYYAYNNYSCLPAYNAGSAYWYYRPAAYGYNPPGPAGGYGYGTPYTPYTYSTYQAWW